MLRSFIRWFELSWINRFPLTRLVRLYWTLAGKPNAGDGCSDSAGSTCVDSRRGGA